MRIFVYFLFLETVSFARPFCLLRLIVFLPYLLLLRDRKPWVFARFLLFGLYVNDMRKAYIKVEKM